LSHVLGDSGVADGRRPALFEFLPMLPTEEAAESSRERWPFIVCRIGVQDERSLWRGQGGCLIVREGATHDRRRDVRYLGLIHEAQSVTGRHRDAVKEVQFRNLQYMFDLAELCSGRTEDRRANGQRHVRDGPAFVHGILPSVPFGLYAASH